MRPLAGRWQRPTKPIARRADSTPAYFASFITRAVGVAGLAVVLLHSSATAATPGSGGIKPAKYPSAPATDIAHNRVQALAWAEETRQHIVPTMHLVETEHFLVFSAWNRSNDALLVDLVERMFRMLAYQFDVQAGESVWVGKCPIYLFWDPAHYARFISEVDHIRKVNSHLAHANGYHAVKGRFCYVVINGVADFGSTQQQTRTRFYHVLVHEATHAFVHRYVSERPLPLWIEEGLADYIAASIVPQSEANKTYLEASRVAARKPELVLHLLDKKEDLSPSEYELAQSLIRFLVSQNRAAAKQLIELLKQGETTDHALMAAYHLSKRDLVSKWAQFYRRL